MSLLMSSESHNLLFLKLSRDVIWGFTVSIAIKVVFTYTGAYPEYLTLFYNLGSNSRIQLALQTFVVLTQQNSRFLFLQIH